MAFRKVATNMDQAGDFDNHDGQNKEGKGLAQQDISKKYQTAKPIVARSERENRNGLTFSFMVAKFLTKQLF